jgi:hypothetical protein
MRFYFCEFRGKEFFKSSPQYRCCQASAIQNPMAVKCPSRGSDQAPDGRYGNARQAAGMKFKAETPHLEHCSSGRASSG